MLFPLTTSNNKQSSSTNAPNTPTTPNNPITPSTPDNPGVDTDTLDTPDTDTPSDSTPEENIAKYPTSDTYTASISNIYSSIKLEENLVKTLGSSNLIEEQMK